jgi:hypothetical protein
MGSRLRGSPLNLAGSERARVVPGDYVQVRGTRDEQGRIAIERLRPR